MIKKIISFMRGLRDRQRIIIGLSKGSAMMQNRRIDLSRPASWEFSGFSQNGEDGILDILRKNLLEYNKYFIEIGAADGIDNNSAWLAIVEKYRGLMIEGNPSLVETARRMIMHYSLGLKCLNMFVDKDSAILINKLSPFPDPDILSLDIDGIDYYVAKSLFKAGIRPKIFVVEYNSAFGKDLSLTIKYKSNFVFSEEHSTQLYYGVSIMAWRKLFEENGYKFITVDQNGVNAFFVDPTYFKEEFLSGIVPCYFAENQFQLSKFNAGHDYQFGLIKHMNYEYV
jgi:hypothetical protein